MGDAEGPIVESDSAQSAEDDLVLAGESRRGDDHTVRFSLAWWLSFAVPISIATVAIMGAVVGYRVEYHASLSSAFDNDAQVSSTYLSGHNYDALLTGEAASSYHQIWEQLTNASRAGDGAGMVAAAEPACAYGGTGDASESSAQSTLDCQLAQLFSGYALPAYWVKGDPTEFNTQRFVADWVALGNLGRDVAVGEHAASANDQRHRELRLLWLGILLALALAFCTLAQAAIHHRWGKRTSRTALLLAVPGWILLIGCTAAVVAWEL